MKILLKFLFVAAILFMTLPAFTQKVVETDNIDEFMDKPAKKTESTNYKKRDDDKKRKIFHIGIGFGLNFFSSSDINDYVYKKITLDSYTYISKGDARMVLGLVPAFSLSIMPIKYLNIQVLGEMRWAPKYVLGGGGTSVSFHYLRYSPGLILNAYLPVGSGNVSLFLGGGAFYHFMRFKHYTANRIGGRGQIGVRIDKRAVAIEVFIAYDYVNGDTDQLNYDNTHEMNLGDHSVNIGTHFHFKVI